MFDLSYLLFLRQVSTVLNASGVFLSLTARMSWKKLSLNSVFTVLHSTPFLVKVAIAFLPPIPSKAQNITSIALSLAYIAVLWI